MDNSGTETCDLPAILLEPHHCDNGLKFKFEWSFIAETSRGGRLRAQPYRQAWLSLARVSG